MQNILEWTDTVLQKIEYAEKDIAYNKKKLEDCSANIAVLTRQKDIVMLSREFHKKAIDILYRTSISELETLINDVISAVFYDRRLRIKMELSDSRSKSLVWHVIDEDIDPDLCMSIRSATGRGIRVVLSFIIQSYYLLSLGSKVLFIDEGYSYLSEAYVGKFFEFVNILCKEKGLILVMISHDERFSGYADKNYGVLAGKFYDGSKIDFNTFNEWISAAQKDSILGEN